MAQEGVQRHWFLGIQGKYVSAAERSEQAGLKMAMERGQDWRWPLRMETAWLVAWAAGEGALVAAGTARVSGPGRGMWFSLLFTIILPRSSSAELQLGQHASFPARR